MEKEILRLSALENMRKKIVTFYLPLLKVENSMRAMKLVTEEGREVSVYPQ